MATKITTKKTKTAAKPKAPRAVKPVPTPHSMKEAVIYGMDGKKSGTLALPESVFGVSWNPDLVHQVVTAIKANARNMVAHTKDRGEVRGGGRKPWKQKGTGRARHGSSRSPIWRGGGITHGPRNEKDYSQKINRKMRARALFSILSRKWRDGEIAFVDSLSFKAPKTSEAKKVIEALNGVKDFGGFGGKRNAALLTLPSRNDAAEKSFRNFSNISVVDIHNLNPLDVLNYRRLIIVAPEESLKLLEKRAEN